MSLSGKQLSSDAIALIERYQNRTGLRGWKQSLAKAAGISPSHLSKILSGERQVGSVVMWRLRSAVDGNAYDPPVAESNVLADVAIEAIRAGQLGRAIALLQIAERTK